MTNDPALRTDLTLEDPPVGVPSTAGPDDFSHRTFEDLVSELERVAMAMDRGEIGIEEAADLYERASALHAAATERLVGVQRRLAELRGANSDGA